MTQYCFLASTLTAVTSQMSTLPSERKKLVWQSWWQVSSFRSVTTRQHGIQGVGATPCGMTCRRTGYRLLPQQWDSPSRRIGLTPLETDWHSSCIHSAISCSSLALSSRGGRSVRITWKAWGRSVLFDRRQPPQCSPLVKKKVDIKRTEMHWFWLHYYHCWHF